MPPHSARRLARIATVLVPIAALPACGSVSETIGAVNPFGEKDEILPGERQPVFSGNNPEAVEGARAAAIGPARRAGDWPQPGGNAQNDVGHLAFDGTAERVWRARIGGTGSAGLTRARGILRIASRPVVAGGRVFVYAPDGTVTALSLANGNRVWSTKLKPEGENDPASGGGVAFAGGRVFAATGYGTVSALAADSGKVLWTRELDTPPRSAPTAAAGKVFVVSQQNEVFALNQDDGELAFSYIGIPETAGLLSAASPAVAGKTVVVPTSAGEVVALDIDEGTVKWTDSVTRSVRTLAISGLADVSGSPVIAGDTVYATGVAGRTIAVSLATGERLWQADIGSASTPVVSGDAVFLVDLDRRMVALDRKDGTLLWATKLPRPNRRRDTAWSGPLLAGNTLWAISNDGRLAALDPANGHLRSERETGDAGYTSPIVADGRMIIVSDAGEVSAYR